VRAKSIPTAVLGILVAAAACSKPSESDKASVDTGRDIRFATEAAGEKSTVSDLEAHRTPPRAVLPEARRRNPVLRAAAPTPAPTPEPVAVAAEPVLEATMRVVTQTELPAPVAEVALPAPRGPEPGLEASGDGPSGEGDRGPMILIRGGSGGLHDDCKLHGVGLTGLGGGGIAINRVAPPLQRGLNRGSHSLGGRVGGIRIR
jgi:hypothetical protein